MNRKEFLTTATLTAFAVSILGKVTASNKDEKNINSENNLDNDSKNDCETTNDILGPFYRADAPTRYDMTFDGLEGTLVELKGKVYQSDCETVLKDALVEIWHCDTKGDYDNETVDFKHRAKWMTAENGEYRFKTILPGKYLNGRLYRPAHIHFRVTAANQKELISQIYFMGDPNITEDPWASKKKAKARILPIVLEDLNGNLAVNFDIYLSE